MPWSGEQRGIDVETFFNNEESVVETQRSFRIRFGFKRNDRVPGPKTIQKWISNVRATGSAVPKKLVGRAKNVGIPENIAALRASIERCASNIVQNCKANLTLRPSPALLQDELSPQDFAKHRDACNAILTAVGPATVAWTSDEAHFHLSGTVNKENFCYWASENLSKLHQRPLYSLNVAIEGVIAGISQDILGRVAENFLKGSICALLAKAATWTLSFSKHRKKTVLCVLLSNKNRFYVF